MFAHRVLNAFVNTYDLFRSNQNILSCVWTGMLLWRHKRNVQHTASSLVTDKTVFVLQNINFIEIDWEFVVNLILQKWIQNGGKIKGGEFSSKI